MIKKLKTKAMGMLLAAGLGLASSVTAKAKETVPKHKRNYSLEEHLKFGAGVAAFVLTHEAGHNIASKFSNTDIDLEGFNGKWKFDRNYSNNRKLVTYLGEFAAPLIESEISLNSKIPKDNSFF